jgi:hypothetical protein
VEGSYEHGHKPSGSIKCSDILEWLSDWRLLKLVPSFYLCHCANGLLTSRQLTIQDIL